MSDTHATIKQSIDDLVHVEALSVATRGTPFVKRQPLRNHRRLQCALTVGRIVKWYTVKSMFRNKHVHTVGAQTKPSDIKVYI